MAQGSMGKAAMPTLSGTSRRMHGNQISNGHPVGHSYVAGQAISINKPMPRFLPVAGQLLNLPTA